MKIQVCQLFKILEIRFDGHVPKNDEGALPRNQHDWFLGAPLNLGDKGACNLLQKTKEKFDADSAAGGLSLIQAFISNQ